MIHSLVRSRAVRCGLALTCGLAWFPVYSQETKAVAATPAESTAIVSDAVLVYVDDQPLYQRDFHSTFATLLRQKFYHGQVPEGQLEVVREETKNQLVDQFLVAREAERTPVKLDVEKVDKELASYDARYANSPQWQKNRVALLPGLRQQLEKQNRLDAFKKMIRTVVEPSDEAVKQFYQAKPEVFTEPEKFRLRVILLKVDPSSPSAKWEGARAEAQRIVAQLRAGGDFESFAKLQSDDKSGAEGGDMGYLHRGMIPEALQAKLDGLKVGVVADPIEVLEGIGIFRLEDRAPSKLQPYDKVEVRARGLLKRELENKAWDDFMASLRKKAQIRWVAASATTTAPGAASAVKTPPPVETK
ncbi:MAG TPA: peptidylprolyl isomerase [Rhodocyclaceae bacterium]|nr:peptidylprolyl isomerase [Rhodocyclaceae bacterium]